MGGKVRNQATAGATQTGGITGRAEIAATFIPVKSPRASTGDIDAIPAQVSPLQCGIAHRIRPHLFKIAGGLDQPAKILETDRQSGASDLRQAFLIQGLHSRLGQ